MPISIHEVFADLDVITLVVVIVRIISIHEVFADLDQGKFMLLNRFNYISIHEVFADLDVPHL